MTDHGDVDALADAAQYVADGWPETEAAERFAVDVDDLRAYLRAHPPPPLGQRDTWDTDPADGPPPPDPPAGDVAAERPLAVLRAALRDAAGLDSIPEPAPLVHGVLQRDSLAWLTGSPGHGKSFVALDVAGSVGTAEAWQGCKTEQVPVLYVIAEGAAGIRARVRAWEAGAGRPMTGVHFLPIAVQVGNEAYWSALCTVAADLGVGLVILDTQARLSVGLEENSARDMGTLVHQLDRLRRATGACVLAVHHVTRNGEHLRGSTALEGAATTVIRVRKDGDLITVECVKQKDAADFDPVTLRLVRHSTSAFLALTQPSTFDSLSAILRESWLSLWWDAFESEEISVSRLVKTCGVAEATFHRRKKVLVNAGVLVRTGRHNQTRYHLTRDPRE